MDWRLAAAVCINLNILSWMLMDLRLPQLPKFDFADSAATTKSQKSINNKGLAIGSQPQYEGGGFLKKKMFVLKRNKKQHRQSEAVVTGEWENNVKVTGMAGI